MKTNKNILVCPLDWGLGHATRLVPIIDMLLQKKYNVIIGADNRPLDFLQQRFPQCEIVKIPGFQVQYPKNGAMALTMIKAYPGMLKQAKKSKQLLQNIISEKKIDVVISDNRYELSDQRTYNIFITHQLQIQTPGILKFARPFIRYKMNFFIQNFNELWIPDSKGEQNLSGKLSQIKQIPINNYHFIGPLSRFALQPQKKITQTIDLLILLSGPEPQRKILENMLVKQASETNLKTVVLQGKPEIFTDKLENNVQIISHLPDDQLGDAIRSAKIVICRSGYSTIMDLAFLGSKAILIPTPGQTEQEYLAKRFHQKKIFYSEKQKGFKLERAIEMAKNFGGLQFNFDNAKLEERIDNLANINQPKNSPDSHK